MRIKQDSQADFFLAGWFFREERPIIEKIFNLGSGRWKSSLMVNFPFSAPSNSVSS